MAITPYGPSTLPTIITTVSSNSPATTQLNNNTAKVNTLASKVLDSTEFTPAKPRPSRVAIYSHQEVKRASANEHSQPSTSDITTISPSFVEAPTYEMEPCAEEVKASADDPKKNWVNKIYTELYYGDKAKICTAKEWSDLNRECYNRSPAVCIQALLSCAAIYEGCSSNSKPGLKSPYLYYLNRAKELCKQALEVIKKNPGDPTLIDTVSVANRATDQLNDKIAQYYLLYTKLPIASMIRAAMEGTLQITSSEEDELKRLARTGQIEAQYILATWNVESKDCHFSELESALADYQMVDSSPFYYRLEEDLTKKMAKLALRIHQTTPSADADLKKQKDKMTALVEQLIDLPPTLIPTFPPRFGDIENKAPLHVPEDATRTSGEVIEKLECGNGTAIIQKMQEMIRGYFVDKKTVILAQKAFQALDSIVQLPTNDIAEFCASFVLAMHYEDRTEHPWRYKITDNSLRATANKSKQKIFELCEARQLYMKASALAKKLADDDADNKGWYNHLLGFSEGKVSNLASEIAQAFLDSSNLDMAELLEAATSNNPPYLLTERMQNQLIEVATKGNNDARLLAAIYASHGETSLEKLQLIHKYYITLQEPINKPWNAEQTQLLLANKTEEISIRINNPFLDNNVVEDTMVSRSSVGLLSNRSRTDDLLSAPVSRAALTTALMPSAAESKSPLVHEHSASATIAEPEAIATMLPAIEEELASVAPTVINMDDLPSTPIPIAVLTTAAPMPSAAESKSPLVNEHSASATIAEPEATVTKLPATEGEPASVAPTVIKVESKENPPKAILSKKEISTPGRSLLSSIAKYSNYTRAIIKFFPQIRAIAEKE